MDPLKGPSLLISSCSSLHRPIGALNTSSYIIRGKGKAFLLPRSAAIYRECGAGNDVFSVHAGTYVQLTHEHSMYSMISMETTYFSYTQ
jgi:hypothetical protein